MEYARNGQHQLPLWQLHITKEFKFRIYPCENYKTWIIPYVCECTYKFHDTQLQTQDIKVTILIKDVY